MTSLKSQMPESFLFQCEIPLRITDLNYGGHVGNDRILALLQEARVQFLNSRGYSELQLESSGLILTRAQIELRNELHYGDQLFAKVQAGNFTSKGFDLFYKLEIIEDEQPRLAALATTSMVCYDYAKKKVVPLAQKAKEKLS